MTEVQKHLGMKDPSALPFDLMETQKTAGPSLAEALMRYGYAFDFSGTGVGKTVQNLYACWLLGLDPVVVTTLSTIPHYSEWCTKFGFDRFHVINWDKFRRRNWAPPFADDNTLFIFDEFQKGKSRTSLQGKAMAKWARRHKCLFASATPFSNPLHCKNFLHGTGLVNAENFYNWAAKNGCAQNRYLPHEPWEFVGGQEDLENIRKLIEPATTQINSSEVAGFPETRIFMEPVPVESTAKYNRLGDKLIELRGIPGKLGEIAEIRQALEMYKVPAICDQARNLLENKISPVIFTNFTAVLEAVCDTLQTDLKINGSVKKAQRQEMMEKFQNSEEPLAIVLNTRAGGEGVSLHDLKGVPRQSLIMPHWEPDLFRQSLGRIHRAGGKSTAIQRVLFAAGTYEEAICRNMRRKSRHLDTVLQSDLDITSCETDFLR